MISKIFFAFIAVVLFYGIATAQMEGDQWVLGYWSNNSPDHTVMFVDFRGEGFTIETRPTAKMWMSETASNICSPDGIPLLWTNGMQIMGSDDFFVTDTIAYDTGGYFWDSWAPPGHLPVGFVYPDGAIILPVPQGNNEYSVIYHYVEEHPTILFATSKFLEAKIRQNIQGEFVLEYQDKIIGTRELWYTGTISAVRHANGRDWWLFNFLQDSPIYFAHKLDPEGLHFDHQGEVGGMVMEGLGQASFSNKGNYFARMDAISGALGQFITLYDVDRCTGDLYLTHTFHTTVGLYSGVAFSPSERYLYADDNTHLWQWDLQAADIAASQVLVDTFDGFIQPGWGPMRFAPMRTAPDGRIYIVPSAGSSKYMHVIERPDLPAPDCKFEQHKINLGIWNARTVPNIPDFRLGPLDGSLCDTLNLNNLPQSRWRFEQEDSINPLEIRFTDLSFYNPDTWHWDFGDGETSDFPSPIHTFEHGYYHVCQTVSNEYASDSTCHWVEILPTDVKDLQNEKLKDLSIAPNPIHEVLEIQSRKGTIRPVTLAVYDMHGRAIDEPSVVPVPIVMHVPHWAPGMYLISIRDDDGSLYSFKVIKSD